MKIEERKKKRMKMSNYSKVKRNFLLLQFKKITDKHTVYSNATPFLN